MADRGRSRRSDSRNGHVSENITYDQQGRHDDESDEYPESIGMEDRSGGITDDLGPRRRDIVPWNGGYHGDEERELQSPAHSRVSDREYRNRSFLYYEEHRSDRGYRNMAYRNTEIQNVDYRQQLMKRQQVYEMAEHRAEDYGRAVQHQGPSRMSYRESGFYVQQDRDPNERAYPENMEMSYEERGLPAVYSHQYPAPGEMQMDRGPQPSLQLHQGYQHSAAWHTQVPFVVVPQPQHQQQPPQPEEEEEKKPRKVWWYTTCRVFSAVLIILNLVSDWLQYSDMSDPVGDIKEILSGKKEICANGQKTDKSEKNAEQFLYLTIAGTVIAVLQMANIIYQIVQNHRLQPDIEITDYVDERTEIFLVNAFIKIPQNFLLHRFEESLSETCFECKVWDAGRIRRFLNGLSALLSTGWRYLTNLKVSAGNTKCDCSNVCSRLCEKFVACLTACLTKYLKKCFRGLIKCCCPCCCCCFDCKTFIPCCCCYISCIKGKMSTECVCSNCKLCDRKAPSVFADLAALPTGLYTFLYTARIVKYFCGISSILVFSWYTDVANFITGKIFFWLWDKIF